MPQGTLEVLLISAKGLDDTDFLSSMDPYTIITCRTQEKKSTVASGKGSDPEWNETFLFTVSEGVSELNIKIYDSDNIKSDDFVGEATIQLEPVFAEGSVPPTSYNVVKDEQFCGELKVGLTFTVEVCIQRVDPSALATLLSVLPWIYSSYTSSNHSDSEILMPTDVLEFLIVAPNLESQFLFPQFSLQIPP